jgi:hypothetical protein
MAETAPVMMLFPYAVLLCRFLAVNHAALGSPPQMV